MDISWVGALIMSTALIAVDTIRFDHNLINQLVIAFEVGSYWTVAIVLPHVLDNRTRLQGQLSGKLHFSTVGAYLLIPVFIVIVYNSMWDFSDVEQALLFFAIAIVHHGWGYYLYRKGKEIHQETELAFYSGQILFTGSIFILIDGPLFWIIFAAQGALWIVYLKSSSFWWKLPGHLVMFFFNAVYRMVV
jgi:hypothetical protein